MKLQEISKHLKIFILHLKFAFIRQIGFRLNFFLGYMIDFGWLIFSVAFFKIFYLHITDIAGWSYWEMMILLGTFWIYDSLIFGILAIGNTRRLPKMIWSGELDGILLKPLSSQFLVSIRHVWLSIFLNIVPAVWFIYLGIKNLSISITPINLLGYFITVIAGNIIAYVIYFMITCLAFYFEKAENLPYLPEVIDNIVEYPIDVFKAKSKYILTWFLPLAFIVSIPTKILLAKISLIYVIFSVMLAGLLLWLSNWFWKFSLKRYSSASS